MSVDVALDGVVAEFFANLDALNFEAMSAALTDDAQGVDEISRGWMRGRQDIDRYFRDTLSRVADVQSKVRDSSTRVFGDVGIVTCVLDQTYTLDGQPQQISAPTTLILIRESGGWKVALVHSVPLPPDGS